MEPKHKLWMRVGCTFEVTPEEAAVLMSHTSAPEKRRTLIWQLMLEGKFRPDGETYIPEECVEDYNETYGTDFDPDEYTFEL